VLKRLSPREPAAELGVRLKEVAPIIDSMAAFAAGFPQALVGTLFTLMGGLKLCGFARGIKGGRDKSFDSRLCGT
jgi:hypothetical protein